MSNDPPPKFPVNFMRTGLDDRRLALVGVATLVWNSLELDARWLLCEVAQWDGRRGLLITANIGNVTLLQITRNLLAAGPLHARTKEELGITLAIFDFMRGRRNGLVHGTPAFDENGNLAGKLATFSAKDGSGTVTVRSLNVTESYLEQMIADIAKCGEFIADGIRKIQNERKFLADETINHRWRLDDYVFGYRAPAIDTDLLRTHLKTLHSRYSSDP